MKMSKKIITLKEVFKTTDKKNSIYTLIYFILNLIKLFLLPIVTLSIMDNNLLTSSIALVFYFAINYVLILLKEGLINASNFSRMKRIEDSFFACIKIDYEFFESKKGRDLFSKAVSTTNSSTSPFSMIYLYIVNTLYTLFYMLFVGFYSLKLDENLFIGNVIFLFILSLIVFFDSLNFSQSYKKIIGIFISKEKNLSYLRKIARIPEKALIFDNFNANDFYQGKYLANEHIIISKLKKITRAMISKEGILNLCKIFLMLIYAYLIIEKNTSLTTIVFIIQFIFVSKNFFNSFFDLSNALDNLQYYFEFLNKARIEGGKVKVGKIEKIEFKNVYFNYEKSNFSLENISFKLEKNKKIGIFGSNGCGKTTIIKLLLGLYKVKKGEILINGINIEKISNLNEIIACVFQNDTLIPASLEENILFGKKYDKEKLNGAVKKSSFIDIMKRNKLDMKTPLMSYYQDHAKDLSMGESQLLFLARCLYKNTNMMIWDEPSSNLDPFKELDLFKKYKDLAKDSMGIFISHKASNIEMFDEIIYMEEGKIVEKGSFKDLMEIKGKYYELYKKQKEIFES